MKQSYSYTYTCLYIYAYTDTRSNIISMVSDQNGISRLYIIVEIYHYRHINKSLIEFTFTPIILTPAKPPLPLTR